jgi:DNA primase
MQIIEILEREGVELKRSGYRYICRCVFHSEKTASMVIFPADNRRHCFGCGKGGDVLQFIMDYKGLAFPQAKKYLGIDDDKDDMTVAIEREKANTRKAFRDWCKAEELRLMNLTMDIYAYLNKMDTKYIFGIDSIAADVRNLEKYNYHLNILMGNDDAPKLNLYKSARAHAGH